MFDKSQLLHANKFLHQKSRLFFFQSPKKKSDLIGDIWLREDRGSDGDFLPYRSE
jgi:hypothetical protein